MASITAPQGQRRQASKRKSQDRESFVNKSPVDAGFGSDRNGATHIQTVNTTVRVHIYVTTPMTCTEARTYCKTYHTDLSTIAGEEDWTMAKKAAKGAYDQSWFSSLIQITENSCTLMKYEESKNPALWIALCGFPLWLCTSTHPFFCYKNLILVQEEKTWEEALEYCRLHYVDLAYLDSTVLPNLSDAQTGSVWTGLRFMAGKWFWVSKENIETNIPLPSCPHEPYRCGAHDTEKKQWENRDCEQKLNFLCI